MIIKQIENGVIVYQDDKPVLVQKGNNFAFPATGYKIFGIGDIPVRKVVEIALTTPNDIEIGIVRLGVDYFFKYSIIPGLKKDSIKLGDRLLGTI